MPWQLLGLGDQPGPQSSQGSVISGKLLSHSVHFSVLEVEIMTATPGLWSCVHLAESGSVQHPAWGTAH